MPESTCLHIQDQESGPIRVVDIPWISVRIGRAAFCEVRLASDSLADEACRLYRRGRTWHLVPVGARGKILVEGRSVEAACPLPFDVPFRIGPHWLTLRQDRTVDPDWQMHPGHATAERKRSQPPPRGGRPELNEPAWATPTVESQRVVEASFRPDWRPPGTSKESHSADEPAASASVRDRWQTRWRAAGAELKARDERRKAGGESPRPGLGTGFESVPLKQTTVPRTQPRPTAVPREKPVSKDTPVPRAPSKGPVVETAPVARARETQTPIPSASPSATVAPEDTPFSRALEPLEPVVAAAATALMEEVAPSGPAAVHEDQAATGQPVPAVACQGEAAEVEPDGLFDQIEPVPAEYMIEDEPDSPPSAFDTTTPSAPADDASWYEIPVLAPAPAPSEQKRRNRQRTAPRKRTAKLSGSADANTASRTAAETRNREHTAAADPATLRARTANEPQPSLELPAAPLSAPKPAPMPSAKDILATHEMRRNSLPPSTRAPGHARALRPTLPREPEQWAVSAWIAGPPAAALVVVLGVASVVLSSWWASDSRGVALVSDGLKSADQTGRRKPLPEGIAPPVGSWTSSTAQHLAQWAVYMSLPEPGADPSPEEIDALSSQALAISPLDPMARLTRTQLEPTAGGGTISPRGLGLSRDAASLCWCARKLLAAGHKEDALNMYMHALNLLIPAEPFRTAMPRFCDDQNVPRYLLPGEERRGEILRELLSKTEWEFADWSAALPKDVTTTLAAARLLKEQGKREADVLIDRLADGPLPKESGSLARALALAARAEACAMKSRWKESEENYRLAIDLVDDDKIKRSWWFNLADIELRLNDETHWQAALRAALAVSPAHEISRKATEVQRLNGGRTVSRATSARAN